MTDIRERENPEFDALAETISDIVYKIDEKGRFTYLNSNVRHLGYSPDELIGKHFSELIVPTEVKNISRKFVLTKFHDKATGDEEAPRLFDERRSADRKTEGLEARIAVKGRKKLLPAVIEGIGKKHIIAEISSSGIYQNNPVATSKVFIGTIGVIKDITRLKRMEEELRKHNEHLEELVEKRSKELIKANKALKKVLDEKQESENFAEAILANSPVGMYIIQDGLFRFVNASLEKMLNYSVEELVGKNTLYFVIPEDREAVRENSIQMLKGNAMQPYEFRVFHSDGSIRWILEKVTSIRYQGKRATLGNLIDITERKQSDEKLLLADRLASIGELVSGIAHEINNPLTSILGFSEMMLKDSPENLKDDLKIIVTEAQRTSRIVNNLLTFARKHTTVKEPVNMNALIEKTMELRAYEQKVNNIKTVMSFQDNLPDIMGSYYELQQVIINLLVNAEYFMREAHHGGRLDIMTKVVNGTLQISFADDGPGITPENMRMLFNRFFTTKPVGMGTGLGLSICHGIIAEHGGTIRAESSPAKGANFIIELPVNSNKQNTGKKD